jgi:hypothetical protein
MGVFSNRNEPDSPEIRARKVAAFRLMQERYPEHAALARALGAGFGKLARMVVKVDGKIDEEVSL